MRVKVPKNIAGGSLMGAHHFVKSALARTNPGGSTSNYKIQATDGTPLTLGDLTARQYDEVLIISGARKNPGHGQQIYPVVSPDFNYPSYESRNIIGNDLAKLLPKDIDGGMLERLSAEVGTFSALNTITRLMYTNEVNSASDPKVAEMLQRYANATRKVSPRSNPGRPFFASDLNDTYRGILSPEEATKHFAREQLGLIFPSEEPYAKTAIERSRIVNKYGLRESDVDRFVDHVLTPYLAVSGANANLIRALRSENVRANVEKGILGTSFGRSRSVNNLESIYDHQLFRKLLALTPMKAEQFYDGVDYAFVAHPAFMRYSLALSVTNAKFIKQLVSVVKDYPDNASKALSPTQMGDRPGTRFSFLELVRRLSPTNAEEMLMRDMVESQARILESTDAAVTINAMRDIFNSKTREQDLATHMQTMDFDGLVAFVRDVGGFRPTAPPYWPRPVVLAMMDTIKENMDIIQDGSQQMSTVFLGLDYRRTIPAEATTAIVTRDNGGVERTLTVRISDLYRIADSLQTRPVRQVRQLLRSTAAEEILDTPNAAFTGDSRTRTLERVDLRSNRSMLEVISQAVISATNDTGFFSRDENRITDDSSVEDVQRLRDTIVGILQSLAYAAEREHIANNQDHSQGRTVNLLSMFMDIEDRARNQYNYSMSENDRSFTLYMLDMTFEALRRTTDGDIGRDVSADAEVSRALREVLNGYAERGEGSLGAIELQNRLRFEEYVRGIEMQWQELIMAGYTPRAGEINTYFEGLLGLENLAPFARTRIEQARDNVLGVVRRPLREVEVE